MQGLPSGPGLSHVVQPSIQHNERTPNQNTAISNGSPHQPSSSPSPKTFSNEVPIRPKAGNTFLIGASRGAHPDFSPTKRSSSPGSPQTHVLSPFSSSPPRNSPLESATQSVVEVAFPLIKSPEIDIEGMRRFFASTPVNMKEGFKEAIDNVLFYLHAMGQTILQLSKAKDPKEKIAGYDTAKKMYEEVVIRFFRKLRLNQQVSEIQTPKSQSEMVFLDGVKKILTEKVFLILQEPIYSERNRKILTAFMPEIEILFKQMDLIKKTKRQLEKPAEKALVELEPSEQESESNEWSICTATLITSYRLAIRDLCQKIETIDSTSVLKTPALKEFPRDTLVENILHLMNKNMGSMWATINSTRTETLQRWVSKTLDLIQADYLILFEKSIGRNNKSSLNEASIRLKIEGNRSTSSGLPQPSILSLSTNVPLKSIASSAIEIAPPLTKSLEVDIQGMRRFFTSTPVNMKQEFKEVIDNVFFSLFFLGQTLFAISNDPKKGTPGYDAARKVHETIEIRLFKKLKLEQKVSELQTPKNPIEMNFLDEVKKLLTEKVFLILQEPVDSERNRKIFTAFIPESDRLFKQMELIEKANRQLEKPAEKTTIKLEHSKLRAESKDPFYDKLSNDYAFLTCTQALFDSYRLAIGKLCQDIDTLDSTPALKGSSKGTLIENILYLMNKNIDSMKITTTNHQVSPTRQWILKLQELIKWDYLLFFEKTMVENNKSILIENIKLRPHEITSFEELSQKLSKKLFEKLPNSSDVQRALKLDNSIRCYIKEKEMKSEIPEGRFRVLLSTFSQLFSQPGMFEYLAQQVSLIAFEQGNSNDIYENYSTFYMKLMDMSEGEKALIKVNFERLYGNGLFEKAWKCFIISQHFLGQGILYFFTTALLEIRFEKFKTEYKGTTRANVPLGVEKSEFILKVNGPKCEITINRKDGLIDSDVILTQSYAILIDIEQDTIQVPVNFKMSIDCPSHLPAQNEKLKELLFDLPLIMESMNFPPLKINYLLNIP